LAARKFTIRSNPSRDEGVRDKSLKKSIQLAPGQGEGAAAGEVVEVGEGVRRWRPGERAMALLAGGGYAEEVVVDARSALRVPARLSLEEAAAVPEVFLAPDSAIRASAPAWARRPRAATFCVGPPDPRATGLHGLMGSGGLSLATAALGDEGATSFSVGRREGEGLAREAHPLPRSRTCCWSRRFDYMYQTDTDAGRRSRPSTRR
jgi:hypothetical protein